MQIKVCRIEDGPARVEIINPDSGETLHTINVNVGQEVPLTVANTPDQPIEVGEIRVIESADEGTSAPAGDAGTENAVAAGEQTGSATAGTGEGAGSAGE
jgi:hypothetical protein